MLNISRQFDHGYAKPVSRGVYFWNGSEDDYGTDNPHVWIDDLVYDAIGAEMSSGCGLNGIKVTIEIAEVVSQ